MKNRHSIALLVFAGSLALAPVANATTVVRMETVEGPVYVSLRDDIVKDTVDNFLRYVDAGLYNNSFIHRSVPNFIIQGGGFVWDGVQQSPIASFPPINNQFLLSNVRGTIAMAKTPGDPNSATNGWYINLSDDNAANLDTQNGGFTVFGSVIGDGMTVVDAIAAIPTFNLGGDFTDMPLKNPVHGEPIGTSNLLLMSIYRAALGASSDYTILRGPMLSTAAALAKAYVKVDDYSAVGNPSPSDAPAGVAFDEGFFNIAMSGVTVGDTVSVVLSLPQGQHPNTYYKYGPTPDNHTPHWYNFMWDGETGAIVGVNPTDVALVFVDGKRGDDDYTANGAIAGVGAPGVGPVASGGGGAIDGVSLFAGLLTFFWRAASRRRLS